MPTIHTPGQARTVVLHADWWSPKKDERGQWLERAVVKEVMTESDEAAIQKAMMSKVEVIRGKGAQSVNMAEYAHARTLTLLRMLTELTDAEGRLIPINKATIEQMDVRDTQFIADEIDRRNQPLVSVTDADREEAEGNADKGLSQWDKVDPQGVAESHFR